MERVIRYNIIGIKFKQFLKIQKNTHTKYTHFTVKVSLYLIKTCKHFILYLRIKNTKTAIATIQINNSSSQANQKSKKLREIFEKRVCLNKKENAIKNVLHEDR